MTTAPPPLVSAVVPTRGRPDLVRETVRAVVDQDYAGPIECVVVHDQEPPDDSLPALGRAGRDVAVTTNPGRPGLAAARNAGLAVTSGDFVASCDDDDVWHPEKIRRQMDRFDAEPELVVLGAGIRLLMADDHVVEWRGDAAVITREALLRSRRKELHSSTLVVRRDLLERIGGYDEQLPQAYGEDYELLLRAVRHGRIGVVNEPLADIRKATTSWFRDRADVVAEALQYLLDTHPELTETRVGHARVLGQIAFARATQHRRREGIALSLRALRRWPLAPHALLALVTALTDLDPQRALAITRRAGRGIT